MKYDQMTSENCQSEIRNIEDFFDEAFYVSQLKGDKPADALLHFSQIGWKRGLDPSPNFSTNFYLERYDDIREKELNPFEHFVIHGLDEGRDSMTSTRIDKAVWFLLDRCGLSLSVAQNIVRTYQPPLRQHNVNAVSLYEYLDSDWRRETVKTPKNFGNQATPSCDVQCSFSEAEKAEILEAAAPHLSDKKLIAELTILANADWYDEQCTAAGVLSAKLTGLDVVSHYVAIGRYFRLSITPVFDIAHYIAAVFKAIGETVAIAPEDALFHYLAMGELEGIRPCAFFNPTYYRERYDTAQSSDLVHYISHGAALGYQPSAVFWSAWYSETYEIISNNPLTHFYQVGINEGFTPNPLIDLPWYRNFHSMLSEKAALKHYVHSGFNRDLAPHPLIDLRYISSQQQGADFVVTHKELGTERYMRLAHKLDPHILFNTEFYLKRLGSKENIEQPLAHYLDIKNRGLKFPNPYFSDKAYLQSRPDVEMSGLAPLLHYAISGFREAGLSVHPLVDHDVLTKSLPKLTETSPLEFVLSGKAGNDFKLRQRLEYPDTENRSKWHPVALDIDRAANSYQDVSLENTRTGILAHVFYVDLLHEVIAFSENVPQPSVLLISTDSYSKKLTIAAELEKSSLLNWEIRVFENRGRDIAPSFFGFLDRLETLEYAVHIHTKRSPHYGASFDKWRKHLFHENGGSRLRVESILRTFESNSSLGALAPVDFGPIRSLISWGYNRPVVNSLLTLAGREVDLSKVSLELPSGSMFWFRIKALRGLFDAGLAHHHFESEERQVDGTLAHAIERAIFMLVETEGYDWARFCSEEKLGGYSVTDDIRFARSRLLSSHLPLDPISAKLPETMSFFCRAIDNPRPRLNLLIPTADLQVGYAGVSEAVRQFRAIGDKLRPEADLRLIATDVAFDNMTIPPNGFSVSNSLVDDRDMVVVPGFLRSSESLGLRKNDCFVASAWWNAKQAFDLIKTQSEIFGEEYRRRLIYLIQDFEPCFYPWSTRWALAESTYRKPDETIAVFNTPLLSDFMLDRYNFSESEVYCPMINENLMTPLESQLTAVERENIVLLYARPHAERNCLEMIEAVISQCLVQDPNFWADWSFLAIGEDFKSSKIACDGITVLGRLSLENYQDYLKKSKLGVSIMVSPHPSYPPLEMAANGVKVLTNIYEKKDLSKVHENIESFTNFDPIALAQQLKSMAETANNSGKPLIDWFFNGQNNLIEMADSVQRMIRSDIGLNH